MRNDILKCLRTVTAATAKAIADRIGVDRLDVARELNALHADGIVEREKRNGNEYAYWLTQADRAPAAESKASDGDAETKSLTDQIATLTNRVVDLTRQLSAAADERLAVDVERDEFKVENESLKEAVAKLRANNEALEQRIDELTLGPVGSKSPLFVTVGRYSKPQRHDSLERAQKRAARLIKGERESAVLILEPVGRVVRGSEWHPIPTQRGVQ